MADTTAGPAAALSVRGLVKEYVRGKRVLDGLNFEVAGAGLTAVIGPSGAGKSTLLHIAGLLETPDEGHVLVNGEDCSRMDDDARTGVRRREMGFIYQFHQLLPEFSALENVVIPQLIQGRTKRDAEARAKELLTGLGLGERVDHRPAELSGGEQQRTAIARALANEPKLILADEPTGNLDPDTSKGVVDILKKQHAAGTTVVMITHDRAIAAYAQRTVNIVGRKIA